MFTFGTLDGDIEGFREAAAKGKDENQRIDDMKDSIGGETFDMINEQLVSRNGQFKSVKIVLGNRNEISCVGQYACSLSQHVMDPLPSGIGTAVRAAIS